MTVDQLDPRSTASYKVSQWQGDADLSGSPLQIIIPGDIVLRTDVGSLKGNGKIR